MIARRFQIWLQPWYTGSREESSWKILEGRVPNVDNDKVVLRSSIRHARVCVVPQPSSRTPDKLWNLLDGSFCINGEFLTLFRNPLEMLTPWPSRINLMAYSQMSRNVRRAASNTLFHMIAGCKLWIVLVDWHIFCDKRCTLDWYIFCDKRCTLVKRR